MKVIIFGGSGFLGSHVADKLSEAGCDVTIFDLKESLYLKEGQRFIRGDYLDIEKVNKAVPGHDVIYNFAGIADIDEASRVPLNTIRTNIIGCANLLEAARLNKIKRFIFASTLYVYSESGSFYRCSKQACELLIEEYQRQYGIDFTILRYGSLYGLRADETNWVFHILKQALTERKIIRYGDGQELREYIHVEDAARCSVDILSDEYINQSVIISGHQQIKICDLLVMIKEIMGNEIEIEYQPAEKNALHYEITPYTFKPRLARRVLANSYVDLGQGIIQVLSHIYKNELPHVKHNGIFIKEDNSLAKGRENDD